MDATAWGASTSEAAFVTDGVWIGFSNGSVTIPSNVVGASTPDMDARLMELILELVVLTTLHQLPHPRRFRPLSTTRPLLIPARLRGT